MRDQGYNVTDMRYGYQGRDAYKDFKHDVFDAQKLDYQEDSLLSNTSLAYGAYFLYEMNNSTK